MDDKIRRPVVDLPTPDESADDEIIYWHTVADGKSQGVRLYKSKALLEVEMWMPTGGIKAYKYPGTPYDSIPVRDQEIAITKAYERFSESMRKDKTEQTIHVAVQGYSFGIKVTFQKRALRAEEPCWRDESGRVW